MPNAEPQEAVRTFVKQLQTSLGPRLDAVLSHTSDPMPAALIEPVLIVDHVDGPLLRQLNQYLETWKKLGIACPLVLDRAHLSEARDVFPLEMLELHDRHNLLFGKEDPVTDLSIDAEHLRLAVEQQLKGKVIHLRAAYLDCSEADLSRLLAATPEGFVVPLRGLLYLVEVSRPSGSLALVSAVERKFDIALPTLTTLLAPATLAAWEQQPPTKTECEQYFDAYLAEVTQLSTIPDTLAAR